MGKSRKTGRGVSFSCILPAVVFLAAGGILPAAPPVDINTAGVEELQSLPGIGPALAQRIVSERETNGPFRRPEEITRVFGIGESRFGQLRDLITVGRAEPPKTGAPPPDRINVNTATQAELETLPGIGPVLARRIIDCREKKGGFQRPEDLRAVHGIGPKTVEALKNLVAFSPAVPTGNRAGPNPSPPSGPRDLKCWRCGHAFRVDGEVASGTCPSCGASWHIR